MIQADISFSIKEKKVVFILLVMWEKLNLIKQIT